MSERLARARQAALRRVTRTYERHTIGIEAMCALILEDKTAIVARVPMQCTDPACIEKMVSAAKELAVLHLMREILNLELRELQESEIYFKGSV